LRANVNGSAPDVDWRRAARLPRAAVLVLLPAAAVVALLGALLSGMLVPR
jgi:hypothetical protein